MKRGRGRNAALAEEAWRLLSQRGWVEVDCNRSIWIPFPMILPKGWTKATWAATFAEWSWSASGEPHSQADLYRLAQQLSFLYDGMFEDSSCMLAWLHLSSPRLLPLPLRAGIWATRGERTERLRALTNADDPAAVEPPVVTEFWTEHLGSGLKTIRHLRIPDDQALAVAVNYAWRSEELETDLRLFASCDDLGRLQRAIPDIEDFARAARFVGLPS
jgi:hypothetical protein